MQQMVFLHGLNTYGDNEIHIGPLRFGPMHARLARALKHRQVELHAVTIPRGISLNEQVERIAQQLTLLPLPARFHLLGQSTGGLLARGIAIHPKWRECVASVMTIGTPHLGAEAAELGIKFAERHPFMQKCFAFCGYDTQKKISAYRELTSDAVREFTGSLQTPGGAAAKIKSFSFICEVNDTQISWPLRALRSQFNPQGRPGDGFISSESQRFGETRGPFALDHFGELGFFPHFRTAARAQAASEFNRLIEVLAESVNIAD